jgi:hypothetical protein
LVVQVIRAEFPVTFEDCTFVMEGARQSTVAVESCGTFVPPLPSSAST